MTNPPPSLTLVQRFILLALLAGLPSKAAAQYLAVSASCQAGSSLNRSLNSSTTNRLVVAMTNNDATRTTRLNASATYGVLQASGSATATATPDQPGGIAQFGNSGGDLLAFEDYLYITSATLPPGTPVEVLVTESFQATVSTNINYSGLHYQSVATHVQFVAQAYGLYGNNINTNLVPGQTLTVTLHVQVGVQFRLVVLLAADGRADANEPQTESAAASLTASATTSVAILTPGAAYYSGSGTVYPDSLNQPSLTVQLAAPDTAVVAWPTNATGFTLQENPGLDVAGWVNNTNLVSVVGTNQQVTINPLPANRFFRLIQP